MTTRKSTPKHEVYHWDGLVVLSGVSRTEATKFARCMNSGSKKKRFAVRRVRKIADIVRAAADQFIAEAESAR